MYLSKTQELTRFDIDDVERVHSTLWSSRTSTLTYGTRRDLKHVFYSPTLPVWVTRNG